MANILEPSKKQNLLEILSVSTDMLNVFNIYIKAEEYFVLKDTQ